MGDNLTDEHEHEGQTLVVTKFYLTNILPSTRQAYRLARTVLNIPRDEAFWIGTGHAMAATVGVLSSRRVQA